MWAIMIGSAASHAFFLNCRGVGILFPSAAGKETVARASVKLVLNESDHSKPLARELEDFVFCQGLSWEIEYLAYRPEYFGSRRPENLGDSHVRELLCDEQGLEFEPDQILDLDLDLRCGWDPEFVQDLVPFP